jgi:hypothetical protein
MATIQRRYGFKFAIFLAHFLERSPPIMARKTPFDCCQLGLPATARNTNRLTVGSWIASIDDPPSIDDHNRPDNRTCMNRQERI